MILDVSMSLDGFIAGPNHGPAQPLGENGHRLMSWFFGDQVDAAIQVVDMFAGTVQRHRGGVVWCSPQKLRIVGDL